MNRTIKFRGKRLDNGEWVYGSLLQGENQCVIATVKGDSINVHECFEVDPTTVGQFIGLLDKNGKEIYEDDIVLSDDGKVGQVQWFEEHLAFMIWCVTDNKVYFAYENDFSKIEVIGNVYENADLLKGEENE